MTFDEVAMNKGFDDASGRQAEITQLMLSSKLRDPEVNKKAFDFLYEAAKTVLTGDGAIGNVSDGYHTFNELYHHRALLFATICTKIIPSKAWKSKQHHDPNFPMYDGMFIVGINTPQGQATYHYDIDPYWDMFKVVELPTAPEFDGHTPADAIERIYNMSNTTDVISNGDMCTIKYRNNFTKECDKFLLTRWANTVRDYSLHTEFYIDGYDMLQGHDTYVVAFRFPGATRGHVAIDRDSGLVREVKFYDTAYEQEGIACYKPEIQSLVLKWEGGFMSGLVDCCHKRHFGWQECDDTGIPAIR